MSSLSDAKAPATTRRVAAAVPLAAFVLLGLGTAERLPRLGYVPEKTRPYVLAFVGAFLPGAASGFLSIREDRRREASPPLPPRRGSRAVRVLGAGLAS